MADDTYEIPAEVNEKYIEMSVEKMLTDADNARLKEQLAQQRQAAPAPEASQPTYPMVDPETGRTMYGSWNDLADPFSEPFAPRNDPNDVAYKQALKERNRRKIQEVAANRPPVDSQGYELDPETGDRLPTIFDAHVAQKQAAEQAWLNNKPVVGRGGFELVDPTKAEDDPINDPTDWQNQKIIAERNRQRRAAVINNMPPSHRSGPGRVDAEMARRGLLVGDNSPRQILDSGELTVVEQAGYQPGDLDSEIAKAQATIHQARAAKDWAQMKTASQRLTRLNNQKLGASLAGQIAGAMPPTEGN